MKVTAHHNQGLEFTLSTAKHKITTDAKAPLGQDLGMNPKELLLGAIMGCTGMDVVAVLRKKRVTYGSLTIEAQGELTESHPRIFKAIHLRFELTGDTLDFAAIKESVDLSLTKYCGVSAMIFQTSPIDYLVVANGQEIHKGQAHFLFS